jgi:probable rRNA maturation factor
MPTISVQNRQRRVRYSLPWLRRFAEVALGPCDATTETPLADGVEVTIVSDKTIAQVHLDFMGLPDATDVITFHHGEIVASAETAQARAAELGHAVEAEIGLYIVHGLPHLKGFDDMSARERTRMHKVQHRIWQACLGQLPPPH